MTVPVVLAIAGVVALLLGVWGGGIKAKEIEIPTAPPKVRFIVGIVGLIFIGISIWLSAPTSSDSPQALIADTPRPECRFNNLLSCSNRVPFPDKNFSAANLVDGKLLLNFNNQQIGSGLAFQFKPPLNVQGFTSLELVSTSTQEFTFEVEYKADKGNGLEKVETSAHQFFPIASNPITFSIPITYDGEIDEIVINFFEKGESSNLIIDSIRLK